MYRGLATSFFLHAAILAWALLSLEAASKTDVPEVPTIEAELITVADFTRLKQGDPNAKKREAKAKKKEAEPKVAKREAPKAKPKAAPPPPAPPPSEPEPPTQDKAKKPAEPAPPKPQSDPIADKIAALTPPPPPAPNADEKKKLEQDRRKKAKEAEKKRKEAERKKKEREAKKRKEREAKKRAQAKKTKKKEFGDAMRALLDKTPEERGAPRSASEPSEPTDYTGPTAGEREGSGTLLTAREADLLKSQIDRQIRPCWRLPGGGGGIETTVVVLSWRLNKDGSLNGQPKVVDPRNDPVFKIAAEAAVRAVNCAAPFSLPSEKYDHWSYIRDWSFDPSHML